MDELDVNNHHQAHTSAFRDAVRRGDYQGQDVYNPPFPDSAGVQQPEYQGHPHANINGQGLKEELLHPQIRDQLYEGILRPQGSGGSQENRSCLSVSDDPRHKEVFAAKKKTRARPRCKKCGDYIKGHAGPTGIRKCMGQEEPEIEIISMKRRFKTESHPTEERKTCDNIIFRSYEIEMSEDQFVRVANQLPGFRDCISQSRTVIHQQQSEPMIPPLIPRHQSERTVAARSSISDSEEGFCM